MQRYDGMRRCIAMRRLLSVARAPPRPPLRNVERRPARRALHTYTVDPFVRARRNKGRTRPWTGMELTCLGTGAGGPSVERNAACVALRLDAHSEQSTTWLFDCGEGTTRQILSSPISHADIDRVFITHLHGDHLWGLPGFLATWADMKTNENKISKNMRYGRVGGPRELTIYGPEGLYDYLCSTLTYSQVPPRPTASVRVVEIAASEACRATPHARPHGSLVKEAVMEPGLLVDTGTHRVSCERIVHRPGLDAYGFVVEEIALPRKILVDKALEAGLAPGPLYQHLQRGEDVVHEGSIIRAADVTNAPRRPRKVAIVGDTCDASSLVSLARDADLVVHEATLEDEQWILAKRHGHSTAGGAGRFAKNCNAKALVLTHMSSRHHSVRHLERLREQARRAFGRNDVVLGRDFMAVPVPRGSFT